MLLIIFILYTDYYFVTRELSPVITCKINNILYRLHVLLSIRDKQLGLKQYPDIKIGEGVIFFYESDCDISYDFSEINYSCCIYFLDSDYSIIKKANTTPCQAKPVSCHKKFRYVIEIKI